MITFILPIIIRLTNGDSQAEIQEPVHPQQRVQPELQQVHGQRQEQQPQNQRELFRQRVRVPVTRSRPADSAQAENQEHAEEGGSIGRSGCRPRERERAAKPEDTQPGEQDQGADPEAVEAPGEQQGVRVQPLRDRGGTK